MSMADRIAVLDQGHLQQLDTPVGLYSQPRTRFVAAFIGSANLLDGTATSSGVDVPGVASIPVSHDLPVGSAATAVLRPEDTSLVAEGQGLLDGEVIDTFFLGGSSTVSIAVPGLARPITATVHATRVAARGDRVGIRFDPQRAVAVADDREPAAGGDELDAAAQEASA